MYDVRVVFLVEQRLPSRVECVVHNTDRNDHLADRPRAK